MNYCIIIITVNVIFLNQKNIFKIKKYFFKEQWFNIILISTFTCSFKYFL